MIDLDVLVAEAIAAFEDVEPITAAMREQLAADIRARFEARLALPTGPAWSPEAPTLPTR